MRVDDVRISKMSKGTPEKNLEESQEEFLKKSLEAFLEEFREKFLKGFREAFPGVSLRGNPGEIPG